MNDITKCYTRAAGAFAIAEAKIRASVPYFIVSSFLEPRCEPLRRRHFCNVNSPRSKNLESRFAIMRARSITTGLFENVEMKMLLEKPIEQPWAYATRQGFNGDAPGLYFRYFVTKAEAEKSLAWMKRKKRWHGPIEYRPGESWHAGYI